VAAAAGSAGEAPDSTEVAAYTNGATSTRGTIATVQALGLFVVLAMAALLFPVNSVAHAAEAADTPGSESDPVAADASPAVVPLEEWREETADTLLYEAAE
jgi:hypothetical protein